MDFPASERAKVLDPILDVPFQGEPSFFPVYPSEVKKSVTLTAIKFESHDNTTCAVPENITINVCRQLSIP
jgi:hypothetical protein